MDARFVGLLARADPRTPVSTCAGWTLADLTEHHMGEFLENRGSENR
ncbi:hypothetical protein HCN51_20350 [Nonomuraea sp. FMUSA5-5]|uniref:Mycothiol-dependent maleylpyruvate isomerase metal-binding domain-containing protein n=1 Tax=Nonomuraea composti TaxID=2720023 RepID=A0ABX1B5S4_9ACTN|nr:hypothetical protein [Nonomuraea sp. FMUSA5-5]